MYVMDRPRRGGGGAIARRAVPLPERARRPTAERTTSVRLGASDNTPYMGVQSTTPRQTMDARIEYGTSPVKVEAGCE